MAFIEKKRKGISINDKFIYNGDFESGKKHGHGEIYWKPIDPELFKESETEETSDDIITFQ